MGPAVRVFDEPAAGPKERVNATPSRSADSALPLSGVRVIDFAIILAGPTCARTLAELGADEDDGGGWRAAFLASTSPSCRLAPMSRAGS